MASWLKGLWGPSDDEPHKDEDEQNNVRVVIQRIETSTVYEDKLEALEKVLDLSSERKQDFGRDGIVQIISILEQEQMNVDIARMLLEVVHNLLASKPNATALQEKPTINAAQLYLDYLLPKNEQAGNNNSSNTIKKATTTPTIGEKMVTMLLFMISTYDSDYYIKYHCLSIIGILLRHNASAVQQCILMDGMGLSKFVSLLQDSHEVIRSEGLAFMDALTSGGNPEVLKIIAFEGAFENLFRIIVEEGGIKGGIIVQDCLQIVLNMILGNQSNQKYFREIGYIKYLLPLLQIPIPHTQNPKQDGLLDNILGQNIKPTQGMIQILHRTLIIINELVKPTADNPSATREIMLNTRILESIILLALSEDPIKIVPEQIRSLALHIVGWIIFNHKKSQEFLQSYSITFQNNVLESAVVHICKTVLFDENELKRQINEDVLKKFLSENSEGQLYIASTVKPPTMVSSVAEEGMLCGISLANAIFGFEKPRIHVLESLHGTSLLGTIIRQSSKCKEILVEIPYDKRTGKPTVSFYHCIIRSAIQSVRQKLNENITLSFVKLLCEWVDGSTVSARAFMEIASNFLFFVDILSNNNNQGMSTLETLSALLIGILCVEYDDTGLDAVNPGIYSKDVMLEVALKRIGLNKFRDCFSDFQKSNTFIAAAKIKRHYFEDIPTEPLPIYLFDSDFTSFFTNTSEKVLKYLMEQQAITASSTTVQIPKPQQQSATPPPSIQQPDETPKHTPTGGDSRLQKYKKIQEQRKYEQEQESAKQSAKLLELQQQLDKQIEDNQRLKNELAQRDKQLAEQKIFVQSEAQVWQQKLEQRDVETKYKLKEYSTRCTTAEQNAKRFADQMEQKEKELETLAKAYDQMEQFAKEKEGELSSHSKQAKQWEIRSKTIESEKTGLEAKMKQLQQEMEQSQSNMAKITQLLHDSKNELIKKDEDIAQLTKSLNQASSSQIEEKSKQIMQEMIDQLQQQCKETQIQLQEHIVQRTTLESTIVELRQTIQQQNEELQTKKPLETVSITEQSYMQAMKRVSETSQRLNELTNRLAEMEELKNRTSVELEDLKSELQDKENKVEEMERDAADMIDVIEKLEEKLKQQQK